MSKAMSNKLDYLSALEAAIIINHKCKPTHVETHFVMEKTASYDIVWEGDVEIFNLTGHQEAKICYAWQHVDEKGHIKFFVILGNQFIDSPRRAVQAALFMDAQPPVNRTMMDLEILRRQLEECRNILHRIVGNTNVPPESGLEIRKEIGRARSGDWEMN